MSRDFDGVDDIINYASPTILDNLSPLSIVAWIYPETIGENNLGIICTKAPDVSTTNGWTFRTDNINTTNCLTFLCDFLGVGNVNLFKISTTNSIVLNRWSRVAVTWDGSSTAANCKLYINGVEPAYHLSQNGQTNRGDDSGNSFCVGNEPTTTARTFNGPLAHIQIFNALLSNPEVNQAHFYPGSIQRGLVWYGGDSLAFDYSGKGNNGTITGAVVSKNNPPINGVFTKPRPELINVF